MTKLKYEHHFDFPINKIVVKDRGRSDLGSLDDLMSSIEQKGLLQPIGLTPKNTLIWGERRLEAHKAMELETIRVYVVSGADEAELLEMEFDENVIRLQFHWAEQARMTQAIFKAQKLKMLKKGKNWTQTDHAKATGMSQPTVNRQLQLAEALETQPELATKYKTQEDAEKQLSRDAEVEVMKVLAQKMAATRDAPQWARDHYVIRDSLDGMAQMADATFDFAEVDPPYAMELDRRKSRNFDEGHTADYTEISKESFPPFIQSVIKDVYRLLKPNSFGVFWYAMQWHCDMYKWLTKAGFGVNPVPAIWYKGPVGQTAQPDVALGSCYEPFWLARKGTPKMLVHGRSNVFDHRPLHSSKKIHATEKPFELLSDLLATMLFPGSNVLIPFLGSGVTLRAAYSLGHTGLGFDLSEAHKARFLDLVSKELTGSAKADPVGGEESE